jgi:hypothetical protein
VGKGEDAGKGAGKGEVKGAAVAAGMGAGDPRRRGRSSRQQLALTMKAALRTTQTEVRTFHPAPHQIPRRIHRATI